MDDVPFKVGPKMHPFDAGVFIDIEHYKKGPKFVVRLDKSRNSTRVTTRPLTEEYWNQCYDI